MRQMCFSKMAIGLVILIGLRLFWLSAAVIAQEQEEVRVDEVKSVKQVQGRVDSILKDKIIITYEPKEQERTVLQTYYLRDENTKFVNRDEESLEPGDIVEITYEESKWINVKGRKRTERIAKAVRFKHSRDVEELRKRGQKKLKIEKGLEIDEEGLQ